MSRQCQGLRGKRMLASLGVEFDPPDRPSREGIYKRFLKGFKNYNIYDKLG